MSEKRDIKTIIDQEVEIVEPSLYHVILLNDDYTTMEFVVSVITDVFHLQAAQASRVMMEVHTKGRGVAGTYTKDIAQTKAEIVMRMAFKRNFPLKCILEEV